MAFEGFISPKTDAFVVFDCPQYTFQEAPSGLLVFFFSFHDSILLK